MRFLLTAAVLSLSVVAAKADDAAKAIVEKAIQATGYKPGDATAPVTWKAKGTFSALGMSIPYTGDWAFQAPDKQRFSFEGEFGGMKMAITVVSNGEKAWGAAMDRVEDFAEEKREYTVHQTYHLHVLKLLPLVAEKEFKLTTAGEKDVGGKKAAGVTVTRDKRPAITLYFDKASGLLVKSEMKAKDEFQGWKEVTDESFFEDYKDAGGRKVFTKMRVVRDGKVMIESELSDQKWPAKLDAKTFEKP
jgi:outer membrane lipoprotein-sorting protein